MIENRQHPEGNREVNSFDDLARSLADGTLSRGQMLKYSSAAFLGGIGAFLGITNPAEAKKR